MIFGIPTIHGNRLGAVASSSIPFGKTWKRPLSFAHKHARRGTQLVYLTHLVDPLTVHILLPLMASFLSGASATRNMRRNTLGIRLRQMPTLTPYNE